MKKELILNGIRIVNKTKVEYDYEYDSSLKKYFYKKDLFFVEYDYDISDVPSSILVIPFLSNMLPISWFAGFDLAINELDDNFFSAQEKIKKEFQRLYPELKRKSSELVVKKLVKNSIEGEKSALLFSGGIDAYTTYFRHIEEKPELITIIGADIPLQDFKQEDRVLRFNAEEEILKQNKKRIIKSNLRDFYSYHVDLMLPGLSWWGEVQHGLALIGSTAPLSFKNNYRKIYIASTHTKKIQIPWGSAPYIDNNIKWADTEVIHDGYELERIEKIDLIVRKSKELNYRPKLRVCYSERNNNLNCSECEKCVRSAFGIMLANDNPNLYGFDLSEKIFDRIIQISTGQFKSKGIRHHWQELTEKFRNSDYHAYMFGMNKNDPEIQRIISTFIPDVTDLIKKEVSPFRRLKFIIINKFSKEFEFYLKIRHKRL